MFIAGVLCICLAVAAATFGLWSLSRGRAAEPGELARRAMAPAQLAAAVMLAAGGVVALAAPAAMVILIVAMAGALGTLAVGSWQSARYALRREAARVAATDCGGSCASCTLSCR